MAGKGDRRRPTFVSKEVADTNYENIFGKYIPTYLRKQIPNNEDIIINEISKLVADETLQATEPKKEENK
jgi:archaeosine-15-forming tRNA-guanine transglycosylase